MIKHLLELDAKLSQALAVCANEKAKLARLRWLLIALEWFGHGILWLAVNAWLIYNAKMVTKDSDSLMIYITFFVAMLFDLCDIGLLKAIVRRQRPKGNIDDMAVTVSVDHYSFPSGHTSRASMMAFLTTFVFHQYYSTMPYSWPIVAWFSYAILLGFSRILLGRHYPLDVTCGFLLGYFQAVVTHSYIMPLILAYHNEINNHLDKWLSKF